MDEFKPVPRDGFCDRFLVSNKGNIYSLYDNRGRPYPTKRMMRTLIGRGGYYGCRIQYRKNGKRFQIGFNVHRMVCEAFHGPPPSSRHQVGHLDGNPINNRADNLAWVTPQENQAHRKLHGTHNNRDNLHNAKFNSRMAEGIRRLHAQFGISFADLGRAFDVRYQTIQKIISEAPTAAYEAQRDVSGDDELGIEYTKQKENT